MGLSREKKPKVVVISGPSGAGKSTIINSLLRDKFIGRFLMLSVSHTTRKKRKGEKHGREYYFISPEKFREMIAKGEFVEWAEVHGNLYGTAKSNFKEAEKKGKILILDIDVQGAEKIRKVVGGYKALFVFVKPPSLRELRRRLERRGDTSPEDIKIRLRNAKEELKHEKKFDATIINRDIDEAVRELKKILIREVIGVGRFVSSVFGKDSKCSKKRSSIRTKNLLKKLISIKSVSGQEKEIGEFLIQELKKLGLSTEKQYISKGRFNVLGETGSSPRIMFSTHIDTVPELGMKKAFFPKEKGGRIYGRGSADTKGAIAGFLSAVSMYKEVMGVLPSFFICFTVDEEEWTSIGSEKALKKIPRSCKSAVVFEPTELKICTSQEGSFEFVLKVRTKSAHASRFENYPNPAKILFDVIHEIETKLKRPVNILEVKGGWKFYAVPKDTHALCEVKMKKGEKSRNIKHKIKEITKAVEKKYREKGHTVWVEVDVVDSEEFIDFG